VKRDLQILLLMTASGSIMLSVETSNLKHTVTKLESLATRLHSSDSFCCSHPFLVIKFCFRLSQIHALTHALKVV